MGIFKKISSSLLDANKNYEDGFRAGQKSIESKDNISNPDPTKWSIIKSKNIGEFLIVLINYPNCTNYEGNKILIYDNSVTIEDLYKQKLIDPHFSNNKEYYSPICRFRPDKTGWKMAVSFCENYKSS
jgi:hypothetical protein